MYILHCDVNHATKTEERGDNLEAKEIGRRLAALRGSRSQTEVASKLGLSTSAISMYENGERIPKDEIKIRIAKFYKKSVQSIFFD